METLAPRRLLSWLDDPATERGIRFARSDGSWDFWSYDRLAELTQRVAAGLVAAGVPAGTAVTLVQRSSPQFVASLFGTMLAGCVPSPAAPPLTFQDPHAYAEHITGLMRTAGAQTVLADTALVEALRPLATAAGVAQVSDVDTLLRDAAPAGAMAARRRHELALLQFTSGSSGTARGVRVPYPALEANIAAIRGWLEMTEHDPTASWLPAHHDMGLIGCLLTPISCTSDLWLMQPEQFIHTPLRYLLCFGEHGARLTAMPNFGLSYLARRVKPSQIEHCDFSQWRAVIVGAERLDPGAFDAFHRLLSPRGLRRRAVLPAYGLAESTLAVTGLPLAEEWTELPVAPASLALGRKVELRGEHAGGQHLIGCGRPLGGAEVTIHDEDGAELPDGAVGEIVVRGPSVAAGYLQTGPATTSTLDSGRLRTGDAGFLREGQLYVLGRLGDSMKIRGRSVFAEDLEAALGSAGVPPLRMAALLGERDGRPTVVALFEQAQPAWLEAAAQLLAQRTEGGARIVVMDAPRGAITRTSSGKPKRRRMWRDFLDDQLPGRVVADPDPNPDDRTSPELAKTTGGM